jgi:hypothetical protein
MNIATLRHFTAFLLIVACGSAAAAEGEQADSKPFPSHEKLEYRVEWRLITAGLAHIETMPLGPNWQTRLKLESAGMVSRLYRVNDTYRSLANTNFCGINSTLEAEEGKRRRLTTLSFDNSKHKLRYEERDLVKNSINSKEMDIAPCTHEILGALASLRTAHPEPGKTVMMPITDGKKTVMARIESQAKETLKINNNTYDTVRYEAFLFDNVLYQRKGRLWIWMTEDPAHVPVQIRVRLGFPIGSITLTLDKREQL